MVTSASVGGETSAQKTFARFCAISGIICAALAFPGFVVAGFIPPPSPSVSAAQVAQRYQEHATEIRIGACMIFLSSMFYAWFTAAIAGQLRRIRGVHPTAGYAQLVGGALACVTLLIPPMFFVLTAFRPDRSPDMTQMLSDMSWITLVMPWPPFMAQFFAFAFAILSDLRPDPLFPRWLAYLNIMTEAIFVPATLLAFFKSGPFAWNGIFSFWMPATSFGTLVIVNGIWLVKAINSETSETAYGAGDI
jgi:hypothetical protein